MAILTNGWYKGSVPQHKITEIRIANTEFVSDDESWDASANQDGSILCYRRGTKVRIVCSNVTEIGDNAFVKFLALKKVSGLNYVTTIGAFAFCYTPNIVSIDLVPGNLTSIGASAFRMSSVEDVLDLSTISTNIIGDMATRHKRWSSSTLNAIQSVVFPTTIYFDVPNPDSQFNYPDVQWGENDGFVMDVAYYGCSAFACYHIWNCLHAGTNKQYNNWFDWYNGTINKDGNFAENNKHDNQTAKTMITKLGWIANQSVYISNEGQLQTIIDRLLAGQPTHVVIHSVNNPDGYHSVAIIGCNSDTHKLAVVDSAADENIGMICWLAFEDIFVEGESETDKLFIVDYNRPILAPNCTWFTQGNTSITRKSITDIYIEDTYTPIDTVTASWDASAAKDGSIMAYVEGERLTLAGNGSGKIALNPDSSRVFSDINKADNFENVIEIHNTNLLDTSQVTTFANAFDRCYKLCKFDGSGWNTCNVTSLQAMFQYCSSLAEIKVSNWNVENVVSIIGFLNMASNATANNFLKELDLSGWKTKKITSMLAFLVKNRKLKILKIPNFDTSLCTNFNTCFGGSESLEELDLSGFDTTKSTNMAYVFRDMHSLKKIVLGDNFSFNGKGGLSSSNICSMPTPNSKYVDGADGNWYDANGNAIAPSAVPNKTFGVYYATPAIAEEDMNQMVLVKKGNLMKTAKAIRDRSVTTSGYTPAEFADAILEIQ